MIRAVNGAFYNSALAVISFVVFTTYVMTQHTITPERVFVVLGLFLSVRVCFTLFFSLGVMYLKEATVSEKRLQVMLFKVVIICFLRWLLPVVLHVLMLQTSVTPVHSLVTNDQ